MSCKYELENEIDLCYVYIDVFSFLESCGAHGPICYNGGTCKLSSNLTFTCQCEHPWSGSTCEERLLNLVFKNHFHFINSI